MRISTISKITLAVVAAVSAATVASTLLLYGSIQDEKATLQRAAEFKELSIDLGAASDHLTEEIQRYVSTGDRRHYDDFWREVKETRTRERVVERLKEMRATEDELDLIEAAKRGSDDLVGVEESAMDLVAAGDLEAARALIFGPDYDARKREILGNIAGFQALLAERVLQETAAAQRRTELLLLTTSLLVSILALTALYTVYAVTQRRIVQPIAGMTEAMLSLAGGNTEVRIPAAERGDEVADMGRALEVFRDNAQERAQAEAALRESEARLRAILAVSPIGVAIARSADATLVYGNRRMAEQFGLKEDELIGMATATLYVDPADRASLLARVERDGFVKDAEVRAKRADGSAFWSLLSLYPMEFGGEPARLGWFYDITERKLAEERLRETKEQAEAALAELKATQARLLQAEKMASLGQLTAGIAHEIKNPLNFINNFSEVSLELFEELEELLETAKEALPAAARTEVAELSGDLSQNLAKINEHGKRADGIVRGMLEHSRESSGDLQETDINALLERFVAIAYHGMRTQVAGFNVTFETDYDAALPQIAVYPQDLGRVFLNIVANACQAMHDKKRELGEGYDPLLRISTKVAEGGATEGGATEGGATDGGVEVRIRDNGPGVPEEIAAKIFQPFFTTKPSGEGDRAGALDLLRRGHPAAWWRLGADLGGGRLHRVRHHPAGPRCRLGVTAGMRLGTVGPEAVSNR